ncbi:cytochrome b/b6 domain-containing protein [Pseudooceanicola sp. CBS1P-1]|uniref:Cytochrome b/b6 domain-containing protein n=1 Tax=Pseudooceanicola albus TaxID=2692189 RepID=A0A6L7G2A2_9RHOB|nr:MULTISPECIES: cytochrome b/b6 domain-containing protein [Pseudooceanicola]MBT9385224.1 cytochrome b/b6 domain-containing protein [Pseudooceanicola endophyticus]MXN18484.1 cytochrome b/b6 domain-containing protein [Pseudooceanicola albus]
MSVSPSSRPPLATRHALPTRLLHAGLALAILVQLLTSLGMEPEEHGHAGNLLYTFHELGGLASLGLVLAFWLWTLARRRGSAPGALFPWLSARRRGLLGADIGQHLRQLSRLRFPEHGPETPLASAVHGLGLCLMTVMAATGTLYLLSGAPDPEAAGAIMLIHKALANLVWAYLIGHAAMAVLAHLLSGFDIREMWSLDARTKAPADLPPRAPGA